MFTEKKKKKKKASANFVFPCGMMQDIKKIPSERLTFVAASNQSGMGKVKNPKTKHLRAIYLYSFFFVIQSGKYYKEDSRVT